MRPRNFCFPFRLTFALFLFVGLMLVAPPLALAQQDLLDPPRLDATKTLESQVWKTKTLERLAEQISQAPSESAKLEFVARQKWLATWQPGNMSSNPANASQVTAAKRTEPKIDSRHRQAIEQVLNEEEITDRVRFDKLEALAGRFPDDIGLNQAILHWIDNDSTRRKSFLDAVERYSSQLALQLQQRLANARAADGLAGKPSLKEKERAWERIYQFALYRRVRGLAYRELPDVVAKKPIVDQSALDQTIETSFDQLIKSAGSGRPEFILIEVRMHRRAKRFGMALSLLEKYGNAISPKWYLKKRRDLLHELRWRHPHREAAKIFADKFPEGDQTQVSPKPVSSTIK